MRLMETTRREAPGRTAARPRWSWRSGLAAIALWAAASCLVPAAAAGDLPEDLTELPLEQLMKIGTVQGASRYEQPLTDAPASVSVITSDDIRRHGYQTLAEALADVRGFYTTYDRNYTYLGVRGFSRPSDYNSRVLVLIDGHRVNESIYGSAYIGTEQLIDMELIDTIEVIRGPGSSLYGTGAFLAVVNIITRGARDLGGGETSALGASYGTGAARAAYGRALGAGGELLLSASGYRSRGQDLHFSELDDPATNDGVAEGVDGDSYYRGFARLRLKDLTITGAFSWREKEIPTGSYSTTFNDERNRTFDQRSFLDLRYGRSAGRRASLQGRAYYDNVYYRGDYFYAPDQYRERVNGYWWGLEGSASVQAGARHRLAAGGEIREHPKLSDRFGFPDLPPLGYLRTDSGDWGLFVQDEFTPHPRLGVVLGLRYDHYDTFGGSMNPRAAVILKPSPRARMKLIHGGAFRAPNASELTLGGGANPDLEPEEIRLHAVVYEHYLRGNLRVGGNLFKYKLSGLIGKSGPLNLNLGTIDSEGVEVEVERRWRRGAGLRASYAYQRTRDRGTGDRLSNSPAHLAKLDLSLPIHGERTSLAAAVRYTSDRLTLAGNESGGFTLLDLTFLSRDLLPGLDLSAGVLNLLDAEYADPGADFHLQEALPQNGRNLRLILTWRF